ncbi:hypothetical protein IVB45_01485 [Bradyrhizobium sp. 4]|nr:hypothetical protein [Bradyrhizobium sp. 39]MCK1746787.1 hypothetical protein [Bradyrhizobium sp. 135]UPJ38596.1 hypothetical protein IVB45_01485 [Bradyrhizobium sp. 4]
MAGWRMYSRKQIDRLANTAQPQRKLSAPGPAPSAPIPDDLWQSLLDDPRAAGKPKQPIHQCRLADIKQHVLRVECRRCSRTVEMQKLDAVRFYGADAIWKIVSQRLLDQTCTNRTGRHEEDGCWPSWIKA